MNLAPIVFIGFIIFFLTMSARVRKQAEEARRANQRREEAQRQNAQASVQTAPRQTAAAPRVQTTAAPRVKTPAASNAKTAAAPARPAAQKQQEPKPRAEARPTVKTDKAPSAGQNTGKQGVVNGQTPEEVKNPVVTWNKDSALQGIILAEILGKPKALRR